MISEVARYDIVGIVSGEGAKAIYTIYLLDPANEVSIAELTVPAKSRTLPNFREAQTPRAAIETAANDGQIFDLDHLIADTDFPKIPAVVRSDAATALLDKAYSWAMQHSSRTYDQGSVTIEDDQIVLSAAGRLSGPAPRGNASGSRSGRARPRTTKIRHAWF